MILLVFSGCPSEETIITCPHGIDPNTKTCKSAKQDVVDSEDAGSQGQTDPGNTGPTDSGVDPNADTVAEDAGPVDAGPVDGQCTITDEMNRKIGQPCTSHTQCETCYCYDEAYLSPFRFCTLDCSEGVGSSCPNEDGAAPEFACIRFTVGLAVAYDLKVSSICMPRCQSVSECKIYAPNYDACDDSWDGVSIQAVNTCAISSP